jgi:hypothetical protein
MQRHEFYLRILPADYLAYYRGTAKVVVVPTKAGETLQFPASLLRKFVTGSGIEGHFVLTTDANNASADLKRVAR